MIILNRAEASAKKAEHGVAKRHNWAFRKGGSFNVLQLGNGIVVVEVEDPAKLTDAQKQEINAACESLKPGKAVAEAPQEAPTEAPVN